MVPPHRHLLPKHQRRMVYPAHVQSRSFLISLLCPHILIRQHRLGGGSWLGTDRLWIASPPIVWKGLPHYAPNDPTFREKMQWWRHGYDFCTEPIPKLKATGRRLDAPVLPLITEVNNVAGSKPSKMVGMNFPTLGCWEITCRYEDDELTFVVWVEK
jgi:hypothetical protein